MDEKSKGILRKEILYKRRSLRLDEITSESQHIANHLLQWPLFLQANTIMLFLSMRDEPQTKTLILHALKNNKTVCVPHIRSSPGMMDAAIIYNLEDIVTGQFDIQSANPDTLQLIEPNIIDLIVVPGVAFDYSGKRCGMGGGYYDRFLPRAPNARKVGMALSCQLVEKIPVDTYDFPIQYIVSPEGIRKCF